MERLLANRYKIENKLGAGGMAIVYKAQDTQLDRNVAIKVLRKQFVSNEDLVESFRHEAQSFGRLSHPNIVSFYDVGCDGDVNYIIMEYVQGKTLKDVVRENGPFQLVEAIEIIDQAAEALNHAHANGLVHRDVKPQNIMVTPDGQVKVTDFGLAGAVMSAVPAHIGEIVGSVYYLSPEQARGDLVTEQADIYSLGIILYELMTGHLPYVGDTPVSIIRKHLWETPPLPGQLGKNSELDIVIARAMAKSANDRYRDVKEMQGHLALVRAQQDVSPKS